MAADHDDRTIEVYEQRAQEWEERRGRPRLDAAIAFTAAIDGDRADRDRADRDRADGDSAIEAGPATVVDLGCGPGWHLPALPDSAIALDATMAMLRRVPGHAPTAPRVRADLRELPFRRTSIDAAWANKSYVHVRRSSVPMALWDLHRCLRVGARLHLGLFEGDAEHHEIAEDDFAGRSFNAWPVELLRDVLVGAGFSVSGIDRSASGATDLLQVRARRERTLADTVGAGMRLLLVGLNPSLVAADAGVGFHRAGNRAWPALLASGLATVDRDPVHLLTQDRIGMTDLVKRASARADGLSDDEYRNGLARLDRLCAWLRPDAVCVVGLTGWRAAVDRHAVAGEQDVRLGGRPVHLMPNPSGVNAHVTVDDLTEHFVAAAGLADRRLVDA